MALQVLTNAKILAGQADLTGWSNKVTLDASAEELDATTFASNGWKELRGGLPSASFDVEGFWEAGGVGYPDDRMFTDLGVAGVVMTTSPTGAAVGDVAYFSRVMRPSYSLGDQVGQLVPFSSGAVNDGAPLVRGVVNDNQARTATGTTTAQLIGAPSATTRVYAGIHILSVSGTATPTITITLQGDTAVGFPSPTTVATSAAQTAAGSVWLAGDLGVTADTYYRLSYVISGTNPSFAVVASIGLGA